MSTAAQTAANQANFQLSTGSKNRRQEKRYPQPGEFLFLSSLLTVAR
jgi:hypothetical protein